MQWMIFYVYLQSVGSVSSADSSAAVLLPEQIAAILDNACVFVSFRG